MNLNKVFIIGNLTRDPEMRTIPSGTPVVSFGVATNRVWKDQGGQRREDTQFHNIVVFGRQAEIANQYLTKGSSVFIEGRLSTSAWEAQDGSKRSRTEIIAERIQLGPRRSMEGGTGKDQGASGAENQDTRKSDMPVIDLNEDEIKPEDLPF